VKTRDSASIAIVFIAIWLAVFYAGADHPPPSRFTWLIALVCLCGFVVFLRIPSYASWQTSGGPGRLLWAMGDGLLAGLVVGIITLQIPNTGEPSVAGAHFTGVLIWFAVLMTLGALNALLIYVLASILAMGEH